jgi:predicted signal transduction protein with EAL and GGDEF domain
MQRSEQLASATVAGAADAIWTVDQRGVIVSANAASVRLVGVAADQQIGQPIRSLLSATHGETSLTTRAGEDKPVLVATSTIESGDEPITVVIAHDISERLGFEQQLALQARRDPLTGLPNRLAVIERVRELSVTGERAAVLYIDLDGFKSVNDLRGHRTGDEVLVDVASRLRENVTGADLVGRLGGDEFVVISTTVLDRDDIADLDRG